MYTKQELFQKFATSVVGENGLLNPAQATQFINEFVEQSELMSMVSVRPTDDQSGVMYTIDMANPATVSAAEATEYTDETGALTFGKFDFTTKKRRTQFELTWEDLQDTIERGGFQSTVVGMWNQRWGVDAEYLGALGDESYPQSNPATAWEKLFKINDGWLTQLTAENGVNILDASGLDVAYPTHQMFAAALRLLPKKYRRFAKQNNVWMTSTGVIDDYRNWLASRGTNLGDAIVQGMTTMTPQGISFASANGVPGLNVFPEDLGEGGDERMIVLGDPKNFIWVVRRILQLQNRYIQEKDSWRYTGYSEDDFIVVNYPSFVVVTGVTENPDFGVGA